MSAEVEVLNSEETEVVHLAAGAVSAIVKSEVEAQLDAAHKYPRSIKRFLDEAIMLATFSEDIAKSCIYSLPRDGKVITGPSVRLAEMCASAYGNLHVGARVVGVEEKEVVAQGVAWDLEKNLRVTIEKRRRITDKNGRRFKDDMVTLTGNAAASIGLRDAIFRVIPKAYVNATYERARQVAVGDASTLIEKRARMFDGLMKMGVLKERVLLRLEKVGIEDVTLTDLETLIGLVNAIKNGDIAVDDAFPPKIEATKGTLDIGQLRPGKEENRGHGNENLKAADPKGEAGASSEGATRQASVTPPAAQNLEKTLQDSIAHVQQEKAAPCDLDDWRDIETAASDAKVKMTKVLGHIMETMGCKPVETLPKIRKGEVLKWVEAQKR